LTVSIRLDRATTAALIAGDVPLPPADRDVVRRNFAANGR
jgi:IMP dehydrogenase/GMP reductase